VNIGILTLTILVLLSPGFFFRRGYYSGVFSKQYFKQNIVESILWTIIPSVIIHIAGYSFFIQWDFEIDLEIFSILLSTSATKLELEYAFQCIFNYFPSIFSYFILICFLSFVFGIIWKKIIRDYFLDSRFKVLRFKNYWHYIFTGEILNFPNIPGNPIDANNAYLDLICTIGDESYIYRGFLLDYQLSKEHELESLALFGVKRRRLNQDTLNLQANDESGDSNDLELAKITSDPYYSIKGQFIVFKYHEIKHINITYYSLDELTDDEVPKDLIISNPTLKKGWFLFHMGWIFFFIFGYWYLNKMPAETLMFTNKYVDSITVSLLSILLIISITHNQIKNAYGKIQKDGFLFGFIGGVLGSVFVYFIADRTMSFQLFHLNIMLTLPIALGSIAGSAKGWLGSIFFVLIGIGISIYCLYTVDSGIENTFWRMFGIMVLGLLISWAFRILIIVNNFQEYWKDKILNSKIGY